VQAGEDAAGGGEFGDGDEPVSGPGDAEMGSGLADFGLSEELALASGMRCR
jgi:hypothetical protein